MKEMTDRQRQVLEFIRTFTRRHGLPPTVREIGGRFRFTPRAAFDHLRALERKGMLQRRATTKRASRILTLSGSVSAVEEIPILGRIAAGVPLLAEENREGALPIDAGWLQRKGGDLFALRVRGESMIDAHIVDGDLVLVRKQESAQPGEIVAALLDDEATVKRFERDGDAVVLKPEHPTMPPIVVRPGERQLRIIGKVVGLLRGF